MSDSSISKGFGMCLGGCLFIVILVVAIPFVGFVGLAGLLGIAGAGTGTPPGQQEASTRPKTVIINPSKNGNFSLALVSIHDALSFNADDAACVATPLVLSHDSFLIQQEENATDPINKQIIDNARTHFDEQQHAFVAHQYLEAKRAVQLDPGTYIITGYYGDEGKAIASTIPNQTVLVAIAYHRDTVYFWSETSESASAR